MATLNRIAQLARGERRPTSDPLVQDRARLAEIPIERIDPDPRQPRVDLGALEDLSASIREHGIIQPLVVSPSGDERFLIIAGHRRHGAALLAGLKRVPAVVRTIEEHQRLAIQIVENLHRKDLNAVEESEAFRRLMDEFGLTQRDVAARVGKSLGHINQALRLLDLPADVLASEKVSADPVPKTILLEIAKLPLAQQRALYEAATTGRVTRDSAKEARIGKARKAKGAAKKQAAAARNARREWRAEVDGAVVTITCGSRAPDQAEAAEVLRKVLKSLPAG